MCRKASFTLLSRHAGVSFQAACLLQGPSGWSLLWKQDHGPFICKAAIMPVPGFGPRITQICIVTQIHAPFPAHYTKAMSIKEAENAQKSAGMGALIHFPDKRTDFDATTQTSTSLWQTISLKYKTFLFLSYFVPFPHHSFSFAHLLQKCPTLREFLYELVWYRFIISCTGFHISLYDPQNTVGVGGVID